jgi:hypothetical protein
VFINGATLDNCAEPLCGALERLAVELIKARPEKYENVAKNEGIINEIAIVERQQKVLTPDV